MSYLTEIEDIRAAIDRFSHARVLWLDTEIADYDSKNARASLIQILEDSTDLTGDRVTILDVLDRPLLVKEFIAKIMVVPEIEKVFHNASYDCRFLGGKTKVKNITCTLELVKKIPYYIAPLPNHQLKTVAERLCHFPSIDKSEQKSDWRQRPLSEKQLYYAHKDPVYTAQIHHRLLQLSQLIHPEPTTENIAGLTSRYWEIHDRWKILDTEIEHLKERLKQALIQQNIEKYNNFFLSCQNRTTRKVKLTNLAEVIYLSNTSIDLAINLTNDMLKELGDLSEKLAIEEIQQKVTQLMSKDTEEDEK
jgi:ribonuclease D